MGDSGLRLTLDSGYICLRVVSIGINGVDMCGVQMVSSIIFNR